ncbi:hypothetical protein MNEG_12189 [Monoraphidium neglectum]|uniref:S1 motif domain-containing protein n=1 Tax=Monoraphidium neglectum TaxID=145388 RepID=A0A0D2M358_9CHLO|nr:hypothetical protein MNEG_12189 [Monoraphidium neglectum]KIY95771.1 hypothetical protein MNEG_12189 [Monoraphidium neglectum]|eukprot:XP_013894791.1 hypothetical protein MNEG_12189 [Monoraphidium neglectum]
MHAHRHKRSVEAYGAFVDVGSESDGLVHVSQLSDGYVKNVADVVKVGASVKVKVLTVDPAQRRLALTMKGLGNAPAARAAPSADAFDAEDAADAEEAEEAFALEAGDVALDGVVYRVDEDDYEAEGYEEGDEYEAEAEGELALIAALENSIVEGKVTGVEDFGVIVEWTSADGAKRSGLLHVSEMRAPAAAAEAELGADAAAADEEAEEGEDAGGLLADEGDRPATTT